MKNFAWLATCGYTIDPATGRSKKSTEQTDAATLHFFHAAKGDSLQLSDPAEAEVSIALYSLSFDLKYIYSYEYEPEQSWTTFSEMRTLSTDNAQPFRFEEECYFRLSIRFSKKSCLKALRTKEDAGRIALDALIGASLTDAAAQPIDFTDMRARVCEAVAAVASEKTCRMIVVTDTHAVVNGTWLTTAKNIREINRDLSAQKDTAPDAILHMGDFTDGVVPKAVSVDYHTQMLSELKENGLPLYVMAGNHDTNYFHDNPERFTPAETERLYFSALPEQTKREMGKQYYYVDEAEKKLRLIFLESFDPAQSVRYGYHDEELSWLSVTLQSVPEDYCVVVFSHVPPTPGLHFWSDEMRGYQELLFLLRRFEQVSGGRLLGFVHGHNHADQVSHDEGFPIICLGCAKCEDCTTFKLPDSVTPARKYGDVTQELFQVMVADAAQRKLHFIRFGAGEDIHIDVREALAAYRERHPEAEKPVRVVTYGSFDLFHSGHYNLLKHAKGLGDYLIVGVTTEHYDERRGKVNVIDPILTRIENVRKTGFADEILVEDHEGQKLEDIQRMGIDVFTVGSDWVGSFDFLKPYCKVIYLPRTPDISSTRIREGRYPVLRMGIVGTGRIAPRFLAEAKYVSGINISSAYNPHREGAEEFGARYGLKAYSGAFETFLEDVDAVYIASPHETHYDYTKWALQNGKHVLCEKPLCFRVAEAKELFALAEEQNVVLMEGVKTAYCPGFVQMINVAKSGVIGEIRDVEACWSRLTDPRLREMTDTEYGGAFLEFGSYTTLPIVKLLGGDYTEVSFSSINAANGIDLYSKIQIRYPCAMATSKTGLGVKSEGQLIIAGTKGYILAQSPWWLTKRFEIRYEDPDRIDVYTPTFQGDGLRYEISEFMMKIHGVNRSDYKLTTQETTAMADLVERFMENRRKERADKNA